MVVRVHNVGKWAKLEATKAMVLELPGTGGRKVRLAVNCPTVAAFMLVELDHRDARTTFLWAGQGMEEIEFYAEGTVQVSVTSEDDVWYFTNEAESGGRAVEAVTFTKIANRRARNPQLEEIMWKAELNMNRRMARLEEEMMQRVNAAARIDRETGEVTDGEERVDDTSGASGEVHSEGAGEPPAERQGEAPAGTAAAGASGAAPAPK